MRAALGAGRGRIVRQLLAESILLSLIGGALGVLVTMGGIRALASMSPPPGGVRIIEVGVDLRTLGLTALISIVTGLLFGLVPALVSARSGLNKALKESPPGVTSSLPPRFRNALVAVQIAVTVVLLVGSGLLMKSFLQMASRDLQFDPDRLLTFEIYVPPNDYLHRTASSGQSSLRDRSVSGARIRAHLSRVAALPGVESVAGSSYALLNSVVVPSTNIDVTATSTPRSAQSAAASLAIGVGRDSTHLADRRPLSAAYFLVTPGFFTSIKAPFAAVATSTPATSRLRGG